MIAKAHEVQATASLNASICFYLQKNYKKSVEYAQNSLEYNKTIKGYYRLGQAYKQLQNYEAAVENFKKAIKMDVSDPNDIQTELIACERLEKAKEKKRLQQLSGFLSNGI